MQRVQKDKPPLLAKVTKEFEIQFRWLVIWILLFLVKSGSRRQREHLDLSRIQRVLFLRYDKIGDMVVTLPTIHALKCNHPEIKIDLLASPANSVIVNDDQSINTIHLFDKSNLWNTWKTVKQLRSHSYDVIIDLVTGSSVTSLILILLIGGVSYRIGIFKAGSRRHYDYIISKQQGRAMHISDLYLASLKPLGVNPDRVNLDRAIRLPAEQWQQGKEVVQSLSGPDYQGVVGINISAGMPNRSWGVKNYSELVQRLSSDYPKIKLLIIAAPQEIPKAEKIAEAGNINVAAIPAGLSLIDVTALIKHLDCVISPDTSICHITSSLDVPLLALYTAAEWHFRRWHPRAKRGWILRSPDRDSLAQITVDDFVGKIRQVFGELYQLAPVEQRRT